MHAARLANAKIPHRGKGNHVVKDDENAYDQISYKNSPQKDTA
jgi:hypothetical protein